MSEYSGVRVSLQQHRTILVQVKKATKTVVLNSADIEVSSAKCGDTGARSRAYVSVLYLNPQMYLCSDPFVQLPIHYIQKILVSLWS